MPRRPFGGGTTDFVAGVTGGTLTVGPATVTFWTARTGGIRITDLLNTSGGPVTAITTDSSGQLPQFQGPNDGTPRMWADAGGLSRQMVFAADAADRLAALEVGFVDGTNLGGLTVTDNGDGTLTLTALAGTSGPGISFANNGDQTITLTFLGS